MSKSERELELTSKRNTTRRFRKPPERYKLNEKTNSDLKQLFQWFENDDIEDGQELGPGKISIKHLKLILDGMRIFMSYEDLKEFQKKIDPEERGFLTLSDIKKIFYMKLKDKCTDVEFENAFLLMDENRKGFLDFDDLKRISKYVGEEIEDEEIQEMLDEVSGNVGTVTKEAFLDFMIKCQEDPILNK